MTLYSRLQRMEHSSHETETQQTRYMIVFCSSRKTSTYPCVQADFQRLTQQLHAGRPLAGRLSGRPCCFHLRLCRCNTTGSWSRVSCPAFTNSPPKNIHERKEQREVMVLETKNLRVKWPSRKTGTEIHFHEINTTANHIVPTRHYVFWKNDRFIINRILYYWLEKVGNSSKLIITFLTVLTVVIYWNLSKYLTEKLFTEDTKVKILHKIIINRKF
jgi:hypothetical protein